MKHLITIILAVVAFGLTACSNKKDKTEMETTKALVVYYSQTHATEEMALYIKEKLNADVLSLTLVEPYDDDFDKTVARGLEELKSQAWPELEPFECDVEKYDVIFLGFPVWFSTYANPIASFLTKVDLSGKKVVPFATFGSGGLRSSINALKAAVPGVDVIGSIGCRRALMGMMSEEVDRALVNLGYIEGQPEEAFPYSDQAPVTADAKAVFTAAVGDYPMLRATPLSFGTRDTKRGTEYLFVAENRMEGHNDTVEVFVTAPAKDVPYFTLVEKK